MSPSQLTPAWLLHRSPVILPIPGTSSVAHLEDNVAAASLRLTPVTDQDRTFIEWSADFDCAPELEAELVSGVGGNVFQTGFDALNRAFGA